MNNRRIKPEDRLIDGRACRTRNRETYNVADSPFRSLVIVCKTENVARPSFTTEYIR